MKHSICDAHAKREKDRYEINSGPSDGTARVQSTNGRHVFIASHVKQTAKAGVGYVQAESRGPKARDRVQGQGNRVQMPSFVQVTIQNLR
jgi:hypothetical protein